MKFVLFLLMSAEAVHGAILMAGDQRGHSDAKMLRGLRMHPEHDATPGDSDAHLDQAKYSMENTTNLQHMAKSEHEQLKGDVSFREYYEAYNTGRGVWKWSNAIDAYDRHFLGWSGQKLSMAEVGVQSGGSILLWQGVLGKQISVFGLDINPACEQFNADGVSITIGDQADTQMWQHFFATKTGTLDILIDDGGHEAHQMLTTMYQVWPKINAGGFLVIEDIHGRSYIDSFFAPTAQYMGQQGHTQLDSVHVYPSLLILQKAGPSATLPAANLKFATAEASVDSFDALWVVIRNSKGGVVELRNPSWGPFLTAQGLDNFFRMFAGLQDFAFFDTPKGCSTTAQAICTAGVTNSETQNMVSGIHIYNDRLIVDVPAAPPVIQAVRHGTDWLTYR